MIHVLSPHYRSGRWLRLQLRCLQEFVDAPFRLVWSIEDIRDREIPRRPPTATIVRQTGDHASKLNALAELATADADDDDLLVFLDGDAFPVAPLDRVFAVAANRGLVAVRREENDGDPQPHPCFCVVSVRQWRALAGDWTPGPRWLSRTGIAVTDVGARLWVRLRNQGTSWTPLLRTVHHHLHPLWFGVYGNLVYHHGAAFRFPRSRADDAESALRRGHPAQRGAWLERRGRRNQELGERVYARLARLEPWSILPSCRDGSLFADLSGAPPGQFRPRACRGPRGPDLW